MVARLVAKTHLFAKSLIGKARDVYKKAKRTKNGRSRPQFIFSRVHLWPLTPSCHRKRNTVKWYFNIHEVSFIVKEDKKPVIAAFDFDGTITYRDTTFFFLLFIKGYLKTFLYMLKKIPILILFLLGKTSRQETKESIFEIFLKGKSISELKLLGEAFAKNVLPKKIRKEAQERINWHLKQGHRCLLVSASIDTYLIPWAHAMGFEKVLSSRLEIDENGIVTGKLEGLNCRREEKVRRLKEFLGPLEQFCIFAYGDSRGDKEMLEVADVPFYRMMPIESE